MRLKIRLNLGAGLPDYKEDQIVDETDEVLAQKLIRMGVAEELPPVRVAEELVPPKEPTAKPVVKPTAKQETKPEAKAKKRNED